MGSTASGLVAAAMLACWARSPCACASTRPPTSASCAGDGAVARLPNLRAWQVKAEEAASSRQQQAASSSSREAAAAGSKQQQQRERRKITSRFVSPRKADVTRTFRATSAVAELSVRACLLPFSASFAPLSRRLLCASVFAPPPLRLCHCSAAGLALLVEIASSCRPAARSLPFAAVRWPGSCGNRAPPTIRPR